MLNFVNTITFAGGEEPSVILKNFHNPEDGFVWSSAKWSEIVFSFADKDALSIKSADLVLDLDVFKAPPDLPGQNVFIYLNGLRIGSYEFTRRSNYVIPFDAGILKPDENVLTFDTPDATGPDSFGIEDSRRLGIQLFTLQIRPAIEG